MSIRVLALDLEGTLIATTYNPVPRPGLHRFLTYACSNFERVALFTAASRVSAMEALQDGVRCGAVPLAFVGKVEFVEWEGAYKDLRYVPDVEPGEVLLVDDNSDVIHPDQRDLWVPISEFTASDVEDVELNRVQRVLEERRTMDRGEAIVVQYLRDRGLRVERFTKEEMRLGKTPDFRVYDGEALAFYCEVKTVEKDLWLKRQLDAAPPGTVVGGTRNDPVYNRLVKDIETASKQFDAVNPDLFVPNVLALVSFDKRCDERDLIAVLTGNVVWNDGRLVPVFAKFAEGRIRERRYRTHMYAWFVAGRLAYYFFNGADEEHLARLRVCFEVDPSVEIPEVHGTY